MGGWARRRINRGLAAHSPRVRIGLFFPPLRLKPNSSLRVPHQPGALLPLPTPQPSIVSQAKLAFARAFLPAGQLALGLLFFFFLLLFFIPMERQRPGGAVAVAHLCPSLPASSREQTPPRPSWDKLSNVPQTNPRQAIRLQPRHGLVVYDL